jgi:hypothetical protein
MCREDERRPRTIRVLSDHYDVLVLTRDLKAKVLEGPNHSIAWCVRWETDSYAPMAVSLTKTSSTSAVASSASEPNVSA